jgi:hypothetical protein
VFLCTHVVFWSMSSEDKEGPTLPQSVVSCKDFLLQNYNL